MPLILQMSRHMRSVRCLHGEGGMWRERIIFHLSIHFSIITCVCAHKALLWWGVVACAVLNGCASSYPQARMSWSNVARSNPTQLLETSAVFLGNKGSSFKISHFYEILFFLWPCLIRIFSKKSMKFVFVFFNLKLSQKTPSDRMQRTLKEQCVFCYSAPRLGVMSNLGSFT